MAATFIASTAVGTASPTLPAGTVSGDYVCVAAYRNAATAPTLPTGWTLVTSTNTNPAHLVAKREYDGAWTMPTFTNANRCVAITVRASGGAGKEIIVGNVLSEARSGSNPTWTALTLQKPDGTGLVLRGIAHTRPDASPPTPTGHTLIDSNGTQPGYGTYRKNSSTDAAAASITISRSTTYTVFTVEVKEVDYSEANPSLTDGRDTLTSTPTAIPPISATQAAYRFYGTGSETGSSPRANQDTPPTGNLDLGDAFGTIRVRMQSNGGSIFPSTDDWTMQWEKNANGSWRDVLVPPTLIHMYDAANMDSANQLGTTASPEVGQTFLGRGATITKAGFYINKIGTPSAGNITCAIYPMTGGVLGTSGVPSNPPTALAVSTTSIAASSVSTSLGWVDFDFDGTFTMVNDVPYVVVLRCPNVGNTSNCIQVGGDSTSPTHAGNSTTRQQNGAWNTNSAFDFVFRIYGDDAVIPWDDPALTDGQATTNRLTGGTGTFVPGQVTEDGTIDNLGITADNFTELAFSVRIKASAFTQGDQLRFRVLRNGAPDVITYTQVPLANVTKTVAPQTVTLAQTDGTDTFAGAAGAPTTIQYFGNTIAYTPGVHRGNNDLMLTGVASGWNAMGLQDGRPPSSILGISAITTAGPVVGIDMKTSSGNNLPVEWVTQPLAADADLNQPIDLHLYRQQVTEAHGAVNFIVERVSPTGVLTELGRSSDTTNAPAAYAPIDLQIAAPNVTLTRGDRLRLRLFVKDSAAGNLIPALGVAALVGSPTEGADGDSYVTFNNHLEFDKTVPTGTQLFLTSTTSDINPSGNNEMEAWTTRGTTQVNINLTSIAGWAAPDQMAVAGVPQEWYTKPLNAFTLEGLVQVNLRADTGGTTNQSLRFEIAVVDQDGTNPTVWASNCIIDTASPGSNTPYGNGIMDNVNRPVRGWWAGESKSIAGGQRLRFRVFWDDCASNPRVAGNTRTFNYNGPTAATAGDTWVILPQTVTEFSGIPTSDGTLTATDGIDTMSALFRCSHSLF